MVERAKGREEGMGEWWVHNGRKGSVHYAGVSLHNPNFAPDTLFKIKKIP